MHAADRNTNCVQHNKTHVDKSARCRANSRPRTHTMTENGARVSEPRHVTKTQDMSAGIQTPRSNMKQGTQTRERATRAHSKPRAHMKTRTGWEYQGSVTKPWITLDRSDRTLTITLSSLICMFIYKSLGCLILGFCLKSPTAAPPRNIKPPDKICSHGT